MNQHDEPLTQSFIVTKLHSGWVVRKTYKSITTSHAAPSLFEVTSIITEHLRILNLLSDHDRMSSGYESLQINIVPTKEKA